MVKDADALKSCIRHFRNAFGLPYAYEIQRRLARGDRSLTIDNIHPHWWYDKDNYPPQPHPFELIQNLEMVYITGRPKGAMKITARKVVEKSTERDFS